MHLRRLRLKNFRSCRSTEIHFDQTLTVLAGENNAGKTNVVDALRLVTAPSDARRTRFVGPDDVRLGTDELRIEVEFGGLDAAQCGIFFTALTANGSTDASWQYVWSPPTGAARRRAPTWTVGPRAQPEIEADVRELVRHVHLHALRDADRDLASSSPGRIEFLLRQLLLGDSAKRDALLRSAKVASDTVLRQPPLVEAESRVRNAFAPLAQGFYPHDAHLRFAEPTLVGLARDLRFALTEQGVDPAALGQSGLGYANLLYLSSVLVELEAAKDAELTLLLVEEPEAHLHPQLQRAVLSLLERRARDSARPSAPGAHAGQIQVVLTTHSPNLTAATSVRRIVVVRASECAASPAAPSTHSPPPTSATILEAAGAQPRATNEAREGATSERIGAPALDGAAAASVALSMPSGRSSMETLAVAIADLRLGSVAERKIDRYLDVTKASLLFARRVLLVEGIAEALLMPAFARCVLDPQEHARFEAATVLAIEGVDFGPYVRLLLGAVGPEGTTRIADRVVVLTDEDPDAPSVGEDAEESSAEEPIVGAEPSAGTTASAPMDRGSKLANAAAGEASAGVAAAASSTPAGEARAAALRELARELGAADRLHAAITPRTLEASLISDPVTGDASRGALKRAFVECAGAKGRTARTRAWKSRIEDRPLSDRGAELVRWMASTGTRKGDLAQVLAAIIEQDADGGTLFAVPPHIADALRTLVAV